MRKIVDDIDDEDDEMDTKDEDGIVKDDPQFTLAITRGTVINFKSLFNFSLEITRVLKTRANAVLFHVYPVRA